MLFFYLISIFTKTMSKVQIENVGVEKKRGGKRENAGKKITIEKINDIIKLFKQNYSKNKISKKLGCDKRTINKVLDNVPNLKKNNTPTKTKEINTESSVNEKQVWSEGDYNLSEYNFRRSIEKEMNERQIIEWVEQGHEPKHIIYEMDSPYSPSKTREVLRRFGYLKYKKRRRIKKHGQSQNRFQQV
jgi:hypothetical protein